jgi:hypothetical protein
MQMLLAWQDERSKSMPIDYDPDTLQTLYEAFDAVWVYAIACGAPLAARIALRKKMTQDLLAAVAAGERDPRQLRQAALKSVSLVPGSTNDQRSLC